MDPNLQQVLTLVLIIASIILYSLLVPVLFKGWRNDTARQKLIAQAHHKYGVLIKGEEAYKLQGLFERGYSQDSDVCEVTLPDKTKTVVKLKNAKSVFRHTLVDLQGNEIPRVNTYDEELVGYPN